jgi:hypothetical protein
MKNRTIHSMGLPLLLLSAVMAWSQSSVASHQSASSQGHRLHSNIFEMVGSGRTGAAKTQEAPSQMESLPKTNYKFGTEDFPGTAGSFAFDAVNGTVVGDFDDNLNSYAQTGFVLKGSVYQESPVPTLGVPALFGMNTSGQMVGQVTDSQNVTHSLIISDGVATNFDPPGATFSFASTIAANGTIVGGYQIGNADGQGYLYAGGQFTSLFFPGSSYTEADDINAAGDIIGVWEDASSVSHGFLLKNSAYLSIDVPQSTCTYAEGINDKDQIAGFYCDSNNVKHGFIFSKGVYYSFDVPRAQQTYLLRVKNNGLLVGAYVDSFHEYHGFTAH